MHFFSEVTIVFIAPQPTIEFNQLITFSQKRTKRYDENKKYLKIILLPL